MRGRVNWNVKNPKVDKKVIRTSVDFHHRDLESEKLRNKMMRKPRVTVELTDDHKCHGDFKAPQPYFKNDYDTSEIARGLVPGKLYFMKQTGRCITTLRGENLPISILRWPLGKAVSRQPDVFPQNMPLMYIGAATVREGKKKKHDLPDKDPNSWRIFMTDRHIFMGPQGQPVIINELDAFLREM